MLREWQDTRRRESVFRSVLLAYSPGGCCVICTPDFSMSSPTVQPLTRLVAASRNPLAALKRVPGTKHPSDIHSLPTTVCNGIFFHVMRSSGRPTTNQQLASPSSINFLSVKAFNRPIDRNKNIPQAAGNCSGGAAQHAVVVVRRPLREHVTHRKVPHHGKTHGRTRTFVSLLCRHQWCFLDPRWQPCRRRGLEWTDATSHCERGRFWLRVRVVAEVEYFRSLDYQCSRLV